MSERTIVQAAADLGIECLVDEPLGPYTTMGVGGPAPCLLFPRDGAGLAAIVRELASSRTAYRVLGAGSNLIVADAGLRTPVIATLKLETRIVREENRVLAGAGVLLPRLVRELAAQGLSGLEFAEGIPGSVGGGLRMNAGAGGRWLGDMVREIVVVSSDGAIARRATSPSDFGYRRSFLAEENLIAAQARFELTPDEPASILERMRDSRAYRLATQPLSERSSGCIFKNPPSASAGAVLEGLGLKGMTLGGAAVSDQHANFIVNRGGAAADVLGLIEQVQLVVMRRTGVALDLEVVVWRDEP